MRKIKHRILQREVTLTIDRPLQAAKITRAFPELRCIFGGRSTVPAVAVLLLQQIPRQPDDSAADNFDDHPDGTISFQKRYANAILSPDQRQTRMIKNSMHCLKHRTHMG